jgi:hypothetical protein
MLMRYIDHVTYQRISRKSGRGRLTELLIDGWFRTCTFEFTPLCIVAWRTWKFTIPSNKSVTFPVHDDEFGLSNDQFQPY